MYVVLAKSAKYPSLFIVYDNVMSQWGEPKVFPTKEDARAEAAEWAGLFHEERKIVVRPVSEQPPVPFPQDPRKVIVRRTEEATPRKVIVRRSEEPAPRRVIVRSTTPPRKIIKRSDR